MDDSPASNETCSGTKFHIREINKEKKKKKKTRRTWTKLCSAIIVIDSDNSVKYLAHNLVLTSSVL